MSEKENRTAELAMCDTDQYHIKTADKAEQLRLISHDLETDVRKHHGY